MSASYKWQRKLCRAASKCERSTHAGETRGAVVILLRVSERASLRDAMSEPAHGRAITLHASGTVLPMCFMHSQHCPTPRVTTMKPPTKIPHAWSGLAHRLQSVMSARIWLILGIFHRTVLPEAHGPLKAALNLTSASNASNRTSNTSLQWCLLPTANSCNHSDVDQSIQDCLDGTYFSSQTSRCKECGAESWCTAGRQLPCFLASEELHFHVSCR